MRTRPLSPEQLDSLADRLAALPRRERRYLLHRNRRERRPEVIRHLLGRAEGERHHNLPEAVRLARAALEASTQPHATLPPALQADLRAEGLALLGNLERAANRFESAERLARAVRRLLAQGTGDGELLVRALSYEASLRVGQRRFQEAEDALRLALALNFKQKDPLIEGRLRAQLGRVHYNTGRLEKAWNEVSLAVPLLQGHFEDTVGALHNLGLYTLELGDVDLGLFMLASIERFYVELGWDLMRLRARWAAARAFLSINSWELAARHLEPIRQELLRRDLPFDAALVGLDLGLAYAEMGRTSKLWQVAHEMYPVFVSERIPREASAVLILFADAARDSTATAAQVAAWRAEVETLRRQAPAEE